MKLELNNQSLFLAYSLVLIAMGFSYGQGLGLGREIFTSILRAIVQLLLVGLVLDYIFGLKSFVFTSLLIVFMVLNAARTASKRAPAIENSFAISFLAIGISSLVTIAGLLATRSISYIPEQVIPISGMIISNSMVAIGLAFKNMMEDFTKLRQEVETKLSLGANIKTSSLEIIKNSIKTGMAPTIDSAKTLGIVALPGMMSGLILAGTPPVLAVKYQIMVTFMLVATTSIGSFLASFMAYKKFFNSRQQLK